jgi:hypothetical protein
MHDSPPFLSARGANHLSFICTAPYIYIQSLFFAREHLCSSNRSREKGLEMKRWREAMSWMPIGADQWERQHYSADAKAPRFRISPRQRMLGALLRVVFIASLVVVILRVSLPQSTTIWTIYETPGDLIRLALGLAVGIWIAIQLFIVPKDPGAYRTWLYLGLTAVPFVVICIFGIW